MIADSYQGVVFNGIFSGALKEVAFKIMSVWS